MHWLSQNWPTVLGWALFVLSDALPYLPTKAKGVVQFVISVGKAVAGSVAGGAKPTLKVVPPPPSEKN